MYRESQKDMKTIEIADFKKLVMERLANPRDYAGRSLVLWNADYNNSGIAYRVIKQCCIEYDKENLDDQVWFKYSDFMFQKEDYTNSKILPKWDSFCKTELEFGYKRMGIIFNTGCYMLSDKEDWFNFINTHTNSCGNVSQDSAVIVCAHADQLTLKEEQFGSNCDIYCIQPTLDEWAAWVVPYCHPEILKVVRAFIEKNGIGDEPYGFEYWQRIMWVLNNLVEDEGCPLNQIPKSYVETRVCGAVSTKSPAPEFCDFIYGQDTSM